MTYQIRPQIIAQYHHHSVCSWHERNKTIAERDEECRKLNQQCDARSPGGTFTSSYMGQTGPQNNVRYREISDHFLPRYEAIATREQEWRTNLGLTISEFLFLDDFFSPLLEKLCSDKRFGASYRTELLRMKASIHIEDWKNKENVGGVLARIEAEKRLFPYAAKRCRTFFRIGLLDVRAQRTIRQFGKDWQVALIEAFNHLQIR